MPQEIISKELSGKSYTWLVTGAAGFIGSHLVENLLKLNQKVVGFDDFSTGYRQNVQEALSAVSEQQKKCFVLIEGSICCAKTCAKVCEGVDYVLHQAAFSSVPRSIKNPRLTHDINATGFLNVLQSSCDAQVKKLVYASSSAVYGNSNKFPKCETDLGLLLSPYAVTKRINELYAEIYAHNFELKSVGLRYFNVYGPRQDPDGAYAAVIPKWAKKMLHSEPVDIYGDGSSTRDYCYVDDVVQACLLAALTPELYRAKIFNVASGVALSLQSLFMLLKTEVISLRKESHVDSRNLDFRHGDIEHSCADIETIKRDLGFNPTSEISSSLRKTLKWFAAGE